LQYDTDTISKHKILQMHFSSDKSSYPRTTFWRSCYETTNDDKLSQKL